MNSEFWQWFDELAPKLGIRTNTFRLIFQHLDKYEQPVIVETGCVGDISKEDLWGSHGCSTLLFDRYVSLNDGLLWSVDNDLERVRNAEKQTGKNSQIIHCDSIAFMKAYSDYSYPSPHLVYLDSYDFVPQIPTESQVHHFNELRAIMPELTTNTLVVVDDTFLDKKTFVMSGKGGLISKYADELGVPLIFTEHQSAWQGFPGFRKYFLS